MHCENHPDRPADGRCLSCGTYLCEACLDIAGQYGLIMCEECLLRLFIKGDNA
ncbi:MAG: hypothetical protein GXX09_03605 [Syntrophomonadaceae bacterium]|nr:hypothetical protein [Syntrophomonadaceae bacterium]